MYPIICLRFKSKKIFINSVSLNIIWTLRYIVLHGGIEHPLKIMEQNTVHPFSDPVIWSAILFFSLVQCLVDIHPLLSLLGFGVIFFFGDISYLWLEKVICGILLTLMLILSFNPRNHNDIWSSYKTLMGFLIGLISVALCKFLKRFIVLVGTSEKIRLGNLNFLLREMYEPVLIMGDQNSNQTMIVREFIEKANSFSGLILDSKGNLSRKYALSYDEVVDLSRINWSPLNEIENFGDCVTIASAFLPSQENKAREILISVLDVSYKCRLSHRALTQVLFGESYEFLMNLFAKAESSLEIIRLNRYEFEEEREKLRNYLSWWLKLKPTEDSFSIKELIQRKGKLFIRCSPVEKRYYKGLIAGWINIFNYSLVAELIPKSIVYIGELTELPYLESLEEVVKRTKELELILIAEGEYWDAILAMYSENILERFRNVIILRTSDIEMASRATERLNRLKNQSYLFPSEVMNLDDGEFMIVRDREFKKGRIKIV